jgi:hypothetical protein
MTTSRDPDRLIRAFLAEGEETLQDRVYDVVRAEIEQKPQRAGYGPWRTPIMNKFVGFGLAAAAVVVAAVIGIQLLGGSSGTGGEPSSQPTIEPTPTVEPSTAEPTSSADGFLPEGPLLVWDSPSEDAPSITMTISAPGWIYVREPAEWLEKGEEVDNMPEAVVLPGSLPPGTGFYVSGDPCQWGSTRPEAPATTVEELVAALAAQASRDASEPVDVTMGGYAGKMITLHVPDDADFAACDDGEFVSYTDEDGEPWHWHQGPGQIDDFWFVNVDGSIVEIRAMYRPDTPIELIEEMRTLVESATFEAP